MAIFVWAAPVAGSWNVGANWQVGGVPQAAPPTAADDVLFGSGTGFTQQNCTMTASSKCRSIVMTGYTGTVSGTGDLQVGDASGGAATLAAGATYSGSWSVTFKATSTNGGAGWGLTSAGARWPGAVTFDGVGGKWAALDAPTWTSRVVTLTNGALAVNSFSFTWGTFLSNNSNTRTADFGGSTMTLNQGGASFCWNTTTTGLTWVSPTAIVVTTAATSTFNGGGLVFTDVGSTSANDIILAGTGTTFTTLRRSNAAACQWRFTATQTFIIGTLVASGTSGNIVTFISTTAGSAYHLQFSAPQTINFASIKDCGATGGRFLLSVGTTYTNVSGNTNVAFVDSFVTSAETGAGADADPGFATAILSSAETGAGTDTNTGTSVTSSSADTGSGADASSPASVTLGSADTGAGADAESSTTVTLASAEIGTGADDGGLTVLKTSAETGAGDDRDLIVVAVSVRPSLRHILLATDALLAMSAGQRAESVQFIVLDADLNEIGEIHPGRQGMTITHDATRTLARSLEGLFLRWDQIGDLDTLADRIRPQWLLQNGVTFPLGVFVFAHDPRARHARGADIHASLLDQSSLLEQSDGLPVSYPIGTNIGDAIETEWRASGFVQFSVDTTTRSIAGPLAWAPNTTRGQRIRDLSDLAGFLPPYFDNQGRGVSRTAPDLSIIAARFRYLAGTTIVRDSIVEDDDRLEASNRYVVVGTSGSDAPIVGAYDLPASVPWSAARRGAVISKVESMQGVESSAQAAAIAKANAMSDPSLFTRVDFDAAADPRHDSWDVITYDGSGEELAYLETGWRLELKTGGRQHHSARRSLIDA